MLRALIGTIFGEAGVACALASARAGRERLFSGDLIFNGCAQTRPLHAALPVAEQEALGEKP
ncbi:MAG: hypothetical protein CVU31_00310 [Betaproteobacteria bacterium HGW-Betaproteobacteria-4]|nr:MAG: hypothetical protein CVU31_00310 [Betaproteobacteria bacterium HGW-Betaproteobacteria-4]